MITVNTNIGIGVIFFNLKKSSNININLSKFINLKNGQSILNSRSNDVSTIYLLYVLLEKPLSRTIITSINILITLKLLVRILSQVH